VQEDGLLDLEKFKAALRARHDPGSVMFVNNEIGVIQDIPAIGRALPRARHHLPRRCRAGDRQGVIDLAKLPVDLMSLASHKTYGPKGMARCMWPQAACAHRGTDARRRPRAAACAPGRCPRIRSSAGRGVSHREEEMGTEARRAHAAAAPD